MVRKKASYFHINVAASNYLRILSLTFRKTQRKSMCFKATEVTRLSQQQLNSSSLYGFTKNNICNIIVYL